MAYRDREKQIINARKQVLKSRFGITVAQYDAMLAAQGGVCAICHTPERAMSRGWVRALAVDHDHKTGRVHGLLCGFCNWRLHVIEDVEWARDARAYLARWGV